MSGTASATTRIARSATPSSRARRSGFRWTSRTSRSWSRNPALELDARRECLPSARPGQTAGPGEREARSRQAHAARAHVPARYESLADTGDKAIDDWSDRFVDPFQKALAGRYGVPVFERLPNVQDLLAILNSPSDGLPVHYPRTCGYPTPRERTSSGSWAIIARPTSPSRC